MGLLWPRTFGWACMFTLNSVTNVVCLVWASCGYTFDGWMVATYILTLNGVIIPLFGLPGLCDHFWWNPFSIESVLCFVLPSLSPPAPLHHPTISLPSTQPMHSTHSLATQPNIIMKSLKFTCDQDQVAPWFATLKHL